MSVKIETIISCDGGTGCPHGGCYADGDQRDMSAAQQRKSYVADGWRYYKGKDYCPDCAAKLPPPKTKQH
jgi:hypothetical protein